VKYQDYLRMSKKIKNIVPKLRFPEFKDAEDWEKMQLGELGEIITGKTPSTQNRDLWGGDILFITPTDIVEDNKYQTITQRKISKQVKTKILPIGSILYTCIASIGKITITTKESITNQQINSIVVKDSIENEFVYYSLIHLTPYIKSIPATSTLPIINKTEFSELVIKIPKQKVEQQKIADFLSSLDELINVQSQKLEELQAHKKGLMQQLFPAEGETVPKLRFAEFRDVGDWDKYIIGDFIESYKGGAPLTPSDFVPFSEYEVVPKKAIIEGVWLNLDTNNPTYCSEMFYKSNPQSIIDSTYLITTLRDLVPSGPSIGYIVKYKGKQKYILAQGVYGIKPKTSIIPELLIHFSNTILYRKLVNAIMVGTTQVHIRNGEFFKLPITVPSLPEQQKIADCLSSLDELISVQAGKIEELKMHKKGLMQGLFPIITD